MCVIIHNACTCIHVCTLSHTHIRIAVDTRRVWVQRNGRTWAEMSHIHFQGHTWRIRWKVCVYVHIYRHVSCIRIEFLVIASKGTWTWRAKNGGGWVLIAQRSRLYKYVQCIHTRTIRSSKTGWALTWRWAFPRDVMVHVRTYIHTYMYIQVCVWRHLIILYSKAYRVQAMRKALDYNVYCLKGVHY